MFEYSIIYCDFLYCCFKYGSNVTNKPKKTASGFDL